MPVATIRDWFVQCVRFDRLRDEIVLGEALTELVRDGLSDFPYADSVGEDGAYAGLASGKVVTFRFDRDAVLVRRTAADAHGRATTSPTTPGTPSDPAASSPIIDSVISELMRTDGVSVTLRLEIDATAPGGFASDDAAVVRDNAKTLKFSPDATGFAED